MVWFILGKYLLDAANDVLDKFLISARRVEPYSYAFFTVVLGLLFLLPWPLWFERISAVRIFIDAASGALFTLALYVFFRALAAGEASRVVPFVFGLVPAADVLIGSLTGRHPLGLSSAAAICLLVPGALLVSFRSGRGYGSHLAQKLLSVVLWSLSYAAWQYAAQDGSVLNHLSWNRIGAAAAALLPLLHPAARAALASARRVQNPVGTTWLFLLKQSIGGASFIVGSWLLATANAAVVNALQGVRFGALFLLAFAVAPVRRALGENRLGRDSLHRLFGVGLVVAGVAVLFMGGA